AKCNCHHEAGPCPPRCSNCNRVGHLARDCRIPPANNNNNRNNNRNNNNNNNYRNNNNNQQGNGCFECGAQGHFKRNCPKLNNNDRGNQAGNNRAPAKVYAVGNAGANPDNVVAGTFLLNNRYAYILFDTGADRSFVSTAFSTLLDIVPNTLDHGYNVELADGRIIGVWICQILQDVIYCKKSVIKRTRERDEVLGVSFGVGWLLRLQEVFRAVGQLIGSLNDKILIPEPDPSPCCARCGTPVDGPSCRGCAFLRKKFDEDLLAYCVENGIFKDFQDTFEPSDDNTNVVNALREPCVVNQDPGVKSSQEPPQIDHNCCYECGDSSDGIFCRQCICKSCGKGAHYGYNCPPKVPIISNPEQCNQTINELPQILPNDHPIRNYEAENSFAYVPNPNSFYNSPNFSYPPPQNSPSFSQQYLCCAYCGGPHFDYQCQPINETCYEPNPSYDYSGFNHPQPPQESVYRQEALNKILKEFEELKRDQRMLTELKKQIEEEQTVKEDMSIEEMRHEQQLVDRKIKEITNDLGIRRFRGEEIDEEFERDCEIRIHKLKQDFNIWGSEVRKKEKAYEDEKYAAACRYMLSATCDDEDDYIPLVITPDLPIEEPNNSLNMGDEHLDTIPATESDEVIKSSVENLVPIPSEFEGIFDDSCDVLNCDNNRVNIESDFVEYLVNRDTSIDNSSKIDPIFEEIAGELAHIAPIPPRIVEADFDSNDDTSSNDDDFEDIEYVSLEEVNDEKEFDLEDIFQIQDVILREKLLNVHRLISNIESLKDNPIPIVDSDSSITSLSFSDNSLPEFESFSDHTEETRSGSTTTHANYSLLEYESFHFDNLSLPRPPPEPPDICLDMLYNNESFEPGEGENIVVSNVEEDDSFTFTIRTFLPFLTYPGVSPLSSSTGSEDLIFDPGIITFHFLKPVVSHLLPQG
ncbi:zf-CCHC domain-containing protein, partial [Tanacetum coccineum]